MQLVRVTIYMSKIQRLNIAASRGSRIACTTRAGVRGTGCPCLMSGGREVRRGCSLCVVSAVQADCHAAFSPPLTCCGTHACTHLVCSAARLIEKRRLCRIARTSCWIGDASPSFCSHILCAHHRIGRCCSLRTGPAARAACRAATSPPPTCRGS